MDEGIDHLTYRVACDLSISFEVHGAYSVIQAKHCQYKIDIYSSDQMVQLGRQDRTRREVIPRITIPIRIFDLTFSKFLVRKIAPQPCST